MKWELVDEKTLEVYIDSKLYTSDVIHKSTYWLLAQFSIDIEIKEDSNYLVNITHENATFNNEEVESLIRKFKKLLIDFQTRSIINKETKAIRELLIAKAFANSDEFDESPPGNLDDTVGINYSDYS